MEKLFNSNIRRLKEASSKGNLVLFIGAGVSINSGVPSWSDLINSISQELPENLVKKEYDKLKIAQLYKNYRGHREYIKKIRQEISTNKYTFNPIHDLAFDLNPCHVVTTNYDDLIEKIVTHRNLQFFTIKKDIDIPYAAYNRFVVKMHGDLSEGNIVLTEDDYLRLS